MHHPSLRKKGRVTTPSWESRSSMLGEQKLECPRFAHWWCSPWPAVPEWDCGRRMLVCGWVDLCGNACPEDHAWGGARYLSVVPLRPFSFGKGAASPFSLVLRSMSARDSALQRPRTSVGHRESVPSVITFEFSSTA